MQDVSRGEGRTVLFVSHNMGAVKNLCKRGIVLNQGQVAFDGGVEEAVDFYIKEGSISSINKIVDNILWKKNFLKINSIKINGTENTESSIKNKQKYLDIEITGETSEPIECGIVLKFKNETDLALATFAEHGPKGNHITLKEGPFRITKKIILPQYLCKGEYYLDLLLNQARTQEFFFAPKCAHIVVNGGAEQFGNPLTAKNDGFLGLESM